MDRGLMAWETFEKVLAEINKNLDSVKVVVLYHGGEPLLNKHFFKMARAIKNAGEIFIKMNSNGMVMTPSIAKELVSSGIDTVYFSLDGLSKDENDLVRKGACANTIIKNIKSLIDIKREMKASTPEIVITTTQFARDVEGSCKIPNESEIPTWITEVFSGDYSVSGFKSYFAIKWPEMGDFTGNFNLHSNPKQKLLTYCDHVENTVTVRADGSVVACCYDLLNNLVMGNIHNNTLSEIWANSKYVSLRRSIAEGCPPVFCRNCGVISPTQHLIPKWLPQNIVP